MSKNIRNSREYRLMRIIHLRKNPRCIICGSIKGRVVHHLNSVRYFKDQIFDPDNLVTLCDYRANNCHGLFHTVFKNSYRCKCTKEDFKRFMKIIEFKEKKNN